VRDQRAVRRIKTSAVLVLLVVSTCTLTARDSKTRSNEALAEPSGIHRIRHVVVIMQENRSFDSYFGTFPGADGIPMRDGVPTVCAADPLMGTCVPPHHDPNDRNFGGPHEASDALEDIDHGRMDGFIRAVRSAPKVCSQNPTGPDCAFAETHTDVMGYHDAREIPNYWAYARQFVLQDHMFEPNYGWSLPSHLFTVSAWSARCALPTDPMTCQTNLDSPGSAGAGHPSRLRLD
jgi:phospholipase C